MLGTTKGSKNAKSAVHRNQVITEYLSHMFYANRIQDNPSQATFYFFVKIDIIKHAQSNSK
jgi:hypothetical protein